jgi:hypothetical protein
MFWTASRNSATPSTANSGEGEAEGSQCEWGLGTAGGIHALAVTTDGAIWGLLVLKRGGAVM